MNFKTRRYEKPLATYGDDGFYGRIWLQRATFKETIHSS